MKKNFNVFISYRGGDGMGGVLGQLLYCDLCTCNDDNKIAVNPFFAPMCIKKDEDFKNRIAETMKGVSCFVALLTPGFFRSSPNAETGEDMVKFELQLALKIKRIAIILIVTKGFNFDDELNYAKEKDDTEAIKLIEQLRHRNTINYYDIYDYRDKKDTLINSVKDVLNRRDVEINYGAYFSRFINWLNGCKVHWGPSDISEEMQNANMCEGLLAKKLCGHGCADDDIYVRTFKEVVNRTTPLGLESRSLKFATTQCTTLALGLAALEKKDLSGAINGLDIFDTVAANLWGCRNEEYGWGMFNKKTESSYCSVVSTLKVLYALADYNVSGQPQFAEFCKNFFSKNADGRFGYRLNSPNVNLIATAMAVCLFFKLDSKLQSEISETFDVDKAIKYVYKKLVVDNCQSEVEIFYGIDIFGVGAKQAPWKHLSIGFALVALAKAYENNLLDGDSWIGVKNRIFEILNAQTESVGEDEAYYIPADIDLPLNGHWIFPTVYLIFGLVSMQKADD